MEATDGTVCYFGEDVEFYENGELVGVQGTWRVGVNGAKPGVIMSANPQVGDAYFQEVAPGIATNMGRVSAVGESRTVGGVIYDGVVVIQDSNPLENCDEEEEKVYAPGLGEIVDVFLEVVEVTSALPGLSDAILLIEHNSTDEDTGFQGFADGDPWNELTIADPDGVGIVTVTPGGGLLDFGLTELFFETSEPENAEVPIDDVLDRLPEGIYTLAGDLVDVEPDQLTAELTHDIPAGPELVSPEDGATGLDPSVIVVSWEAVSEDIGGDPVSIVAYQVIVEEDAVPPFPQGFARPVCSVHLPATATNVSVPAEFMKDDTCYKYEVLAIEESGNQTLSSAIFETGESCVRPEEGDDTTRLTQAKVLIEHNSTDEDTGFQGFADGVEIVRVTAEGGFFDFGLTELFYETSEPPNAEVAIDEVIERLPEGTYTFRGAMVDDDESTLTAAFTHDIPAGPELISTEDGAEGVEPANTVVVWEAGDDRHRWRADHHRRIPGHRRGLQRVPAGHRDQRDSACRVHAERHRV